VLAFQPSPRRQINTPFGPLLLEHHQDAANAGIATGVLADRLIHAAAALVDLLEDGVADFGNVELGKLELGAAACPAGEEGRILPPVRFLELGADALELVHRDEFGYGSQSSRSHGQLILAH
jgi:hypothetical protein